MAPNPQIEREHQHSLLCTSIGSEGSGAARYGAAMFFYNMGLIGGEMLEIYRRCSKFDHEDPIDLARFEQVEPPSFVTSCPSRSAT
tara:strand:+ start:612 stop:869 length:258 start_codon:yes stop_codon:yes gene_type:complete